MTPTVVSLFSGVGGMDLGFEQAGWETLARCESDSYRRSVLRARFGISAPVYDDVNTFPASEYQRADLVMGGFPCQDLSVAGRRAGLTGARSGLFFRAAEIVDQIQPRWVLLENVPGLLTSHEGADFGVLLDTMVELGYGVGWRTLDAQYFDVPQRRPRVFILARRVDGDSSRAARSAGEVLALGSRCTRHPPKGFASRSGRTGAPGWGAEEAGGDELIAGTLTSNPTGGRRNGPEEMGANHLVAGALTNVSVTNYGREAVTSSHVLPSGEGVRMLTPVECERLQGFPDGWSDRGGSPDTKRYAALGDAVAVPVAEWIARRLHATFLIR